DKLFTHVIRIRCICRLILQKRYRRVSRTAVRMTLQYIQHLCRVFEEACRTQWLDLKVSDPQVDDGIGSIRQTSQRRRRRQALATGADSHLKIHSRSLVWADGDLVARNMIEPRQTCRDSVRVGWQRLEFITTIRTRDY